MIAGWSQCEPPANDGGGNDRCPRLGCRKYWSASGRRSRPISRPRRSAADMWRFSKINAALANPKLATENDAEEYGKGHEFPTATFKTAWDVGATLEKYLSAEIGAWAVCFGLGKVVKSGRWQLYVYTCTPLIPAAGDAAELPYLSYVEQIRPGAGVRPRPAGGWPGGRRLPDHRWLRSWPRQQQDQRRVGRIRQGHRLRDRHHDARRDDGEAPAVRFADARRSTASTM